VFYAIIIIHTQQATCIFFSGGYPSSSQHPRTIQTETLYIYRILLWAALICRPDDGSILEPKLVARKSFTSVCCEWSILE